MGKHVIILGAGASYTSGYPLAADLRVLLSSFGALDNYLHKYFKPDAANHAGFTFLRHWFGAQPDSLLLFKEGCYGTVDEFSFLAGKQYPKEVHQLKQIVGVLLALHNPEDTFVSKGKSTSGFETSDYYAFIQRLFRESAEIRDDTVVLTYNYDPYLDFLLYRAYQRRKEALGIAHSLPPTELTSGFSDRDSKKILEGNGFCYLKLHGTAVLPPQIGVAAEGSLPDRNLTYSEVFSKRDDWFKTADGKLFGLNPSPAIYFPWELITENGEFVQKDQFAGLESLANSQYFSHIGRTQYDLCKSIWERARREIACAEKISFVGLSMHRFLEGGLRYLFADRVNKFPDRVDLETEIILACPGARYPGSDFKTMAAPNSLADRLITTLTRVYPKAVKRSTSGCLASLNTGKAGTGGVVCYEDFESFIRSEL